MVTPTHNFSLTQAQNTENQCNLALSLFGRLSLIALVHPFNLITLSDTLRDALRESSNLIWVSGGLFNLIILGDLFH